MDTSHTSLTQTEEMDQLRRHGTVVSTIQDQDIYLGLLFIKMDQHMRINVLLTLQRQENGIIMRLSSPPHHTPQSISVTDRASEHTQQEQ